MLGRPTGRMTELSPFALNPPANADVRYFEELIKPAYDEVENLYHFAFVLAQEALSGLRL